MIFKRFLTRTPRPAKLAEDQDALIELVRSDRDTARRLEACRLIGRLSELRDLAGADIDAGVREVALARYRKLLCGLDERPPPLSERLSEIVGMVDQQTLEYTAANATESEVRLAAIGRLLDPGALAGSALNDAAAGNRAAAAEHLTDKGTLEQVARQIGKRDKNVYRIARRKLKEINEREALPTRIRLQCETICEKLERLGRFENWVQDRVMLDHLDRQWTEVEPQADKEYLERYRAGRDRFLASYEEYRQEHAAQIAEVEALAANRAARERLVEELDLCAPQVDEHSLRERIGDIETRWNALEYVSAGWVKSLERRYAAARDRAAARLDVLRSRRKASVRLRQMHESARRMLDQSRPIDCARMTRLVADAKPLLATEGLDQALLDEFRETQARLEERLSKQVRHAQQRLVRARERMTELVDAVESGELKRAEPLFQSLQASIDLAESSGLEHEMLPNLRSELRALGPRLRDLQQWRKYGTDTHREGLCQAMVELEQADMPLEAKALRLHDLQMEWKGLDKGGSPVNQHLWDRFHAASDKVYACCKPYLDQQAAQRDAACREREALCQQLEEFLEQVDWERIDWKLVLRAERDMRKGWAAMGEVDGRRRRALQRRFYSAMKVLDDRLSAEREANQAFKRGLIEHVEALATEPDLDRAIEQTKRLQREWRTTVSARQKDENRLWQRFRAACDAVFARRRQQHEIQTAELDENLKIRQAICAEAESLTSASLQPEVLRSELRAIEGRWVDTESLPLPHRAAGMLNQRWREAQSGIRRRCQELLAEERRASLDLLARQAAICDGLERAIEAGDAGAPDTAAAEIAWNALPPQPDPDLQRSIETRFRAALSASAGGGALRSSLAENARRRAELCLQLEILAQVNSPPELTHERLAFQVNRLKEHMRAGEKDPLAGAAHLLESWYCCGPAPAKVAPGLEARFTRARNALERAGRDSGRPPGG